MSKDKVLALDVASITGWAISKTIFGEWDLTTRKDESMGMKLIRFLSKLEEIVEAMGIKIIIYERPAGFHRGALIHEAKMIGVLEEFCERKRIDYRAYSASEIKKFATGKGNANKDMMIKAAKEKYGYQGKSHNIADALHLRFLFKHETGI